MFAVVPMDAYREGRLGIRATYRTGGQLLNRRRMHFQSRVCTTTFHELLFVVDCALNATSEGDIQRITDLFAADCDNFGLIINTEKTVEELVRDRLTWRRKVKTGAAICEANRIIAAKAERKARKPQLRVHFPAPKTNRPQADHDVSGRSGHQSVSLDIFEPTAAPGRHYPIPPPVHLRLAPHFYNQPQPRSPSLTASKPAAAAPAPTNTSHNPDVPSNISLTTAKSSDVDRVQTCPRRDRTFTSHIGLVGHLRIHRTKTG
nr:unnamed protein product [Spirometra erinaceieuropaei]